MKQRLLIDEQKLKKICFTHDGKTVCGADQEWYPTKWQQLAGCAPTTAAVMFACFDDATPPRRSVEDWLQLMQDWWNFITPGFMGVNRIRKFTFGAEMFFTKHCLPYETRALAFPCGEYPPLEEAEAFLREGLQNGCPVAFLNLGNALEKTLSAWHWMTVVGIKRVDDSLLLTIFDEGKQTDVDFSLWHKEASGSGGLIFFTKKPAAAA